MQVSLVATLKDEADSVRSFLDGLFAQSRPPDEIVLVDGGSTDGTLEEIERAERSSPVRVRVIEAPGANISQGRNIAIAAASHELIAVTDAGTRPRPDWLERLVEPLERDERTAVAAGFFEAGGEGWLQRTLASAITPQREEIAAEKFLPSSRSVAFRRAWWARVDGYPEWLGHCEDLVFDLDLRRAGASFEFVPDAVVSWDARPDLRSFARQYFNYARGDGHADLWRKRHLLRYCAYTAGLLGLRRRSPRAVAALGIGWLAYQGKFARRLLRRPPSRRRSEQVAALALLPVIVSTGDAAKMLGYAVGSYERVSGAVAAPERPSP